MCNCDHCVLLKTGILANLVQKSFATLLDKTLSESFLT